MKTQKAIKAVLAPPPAHMVGDGFKVHNFFPSGPIGDQGMSPFFLLDYNAKTDFPPTDTPRGVGVHPHRGFETVTIAYKGKIAHHDSRGNSGVIGEGDVQWMTAASGILHKEYHETEYSQKGGPFQMVQLWVNLPAKDKMTTPRYQSLLAQDMGKYNIPNLGGTLHVIAGTYKEIEGPAKTFSPLNVYDARLKPGAKLDFNFSPSSNTGILVLEGSIRINGAESVLANRFVLFEKEGEQIEIESTEESLLLILNGEPLNEPLVQYGPFLMNTNAEIDQAIEDYNAGKFGRLK
jgi:redox-sensitive bicupin YhaK (pirin superfamily)